MFSFAVCREICHHRLQWLHVSCMACVTCVCVCVTLINLSNVCVVRVHSIYLAPAFDCVDENQRYPVAYDLIRCFTIHLSSFSVAWVSSPTWFSGWANNSITRNYALNAAINFVPATKAYGAGIVNGRHWPALPCPDCIVGNGCVWLVL